MAVSGRDIVVLWKNGGAWQPFADATSCELEVSAEMADVTTGQWSESKPRNLSWSLRGSYLTGDSSMLDDYRQWMTDGRTITCMIASLDGILIKKGNCYISGLTVNAGNGQVVGFEMSLTGTDSLINETMNRYFQGERIGFSGQLTESETVITSLTVEMQVFRLGSNVMLESHQMTVEPVSQTYTYIMETNDKYGLYEVRFVVKDQNDIVVSNESVRINIYR